MPAAAPQHPTEKESDVATTRRNTKRTFDFDATRPFYAAVGAGDAAVAYARSAAGEVQARMHRLQRADLDPKALREQAIATVEGRIADLQSDAKALPGRVEQVVNEYVAELNKAIDELNRNYADLASRGEGFVARVRRQEATKQTRSAARSTTTKAKTTRTQAKKSAKTASTSAKATGTSAKKTASAAKRATGDAARKAGK
jgi:heparin binding hemagglutinin HbhA